MDRAVAEAVDRLVWPLPHKIPEIDRLVEEAAAKVDWPVTNKAPEVKTVVEALVTVKRLEEELKVRLLEPAVEDAAVA